MNEPVNPYASPEADLTTVPFEKKERLSMRGMRTTGIGLSLVYYGTIIILLAILVTFISMFALVSAAGLWAAQSEMSKIMLICSVAAISGALLNLSGQIACLFVPLELGAKGYIITAVVLQIASLFQSILPFIQRLMPELQIPYPLMMAIYFGGIASLLFFIQFLRKLSEFIGLKEFKNKASNILVLGFILICIAGIIFVGTILKSRPYGLLGIILIVGALSGLVMYVNLVNGLRKILLGKELKVQNPS